MKVLLDLTSTLLLRALSLAARILPYALIQKALLVLLKCLLLLQPKHLRVGRENLKIAFPDKSPEERERILNGHIVFLSRLVTDSLQLPSLDATWARAHILFPEERNHRALKETPGPGTLIATGHLGSFELFAFSAGLLGYQLSYVVRSFPYPRLDSWWCKTRERSGNSVIRREGAYKRIIARLQRGEDVGVLFDQNVTRNHAVFPKWFSLEAATTKAIGFAALQTNAPLVVSSLAYVGEGKHVILWERCHIEHIRDNETLSREAKIQKITQVAVDSFCRMIEQYPEQWFWLHRRWKTRPQKGKHPYR